MPFVKGVSGSTRLTAVSRKGNVARPTQVRDIRKGDRILVYSKNCKERKYAKVEEVWVSKEEVYRYQIQQFGLPLVIEATDPPPFVFEKGKVLVRGTPCELLGRPERIGEAYVYNFKLEPIPEEYYMDGVVFLEPI